MFFWNKIQLLLATGLCMGAISVLFSPGISADDYILNPGSSGGYGTVASAVDLYSQSVNGSTISSQLKIGDRVVIQSGTNYFKGSYYSKSGAASLSDRYFLDITGGATVFTERIFASSYGWNGNAANTLTISGAGTTVSTPVVYNWNVGGVLTVKDNAKLTVTAANYSDGSPANNFTFGTELNLESGGTISIPRIETMRVSKKSEGPAQYNISGKSTLNISGNWTLLTDHSDPSFSNGYTQVNVYGSGNAIAVGDTFTLNRTTVTTGAPQSELTFHIDSDGASTIAARNVNIPNLKTTAQLQYASALTRVGDAILGTYTIIKASDSFVGPDANYMSGNPLSTTDLWVTNKHTTDKYMDAYLNNNFKESALNYNISRSISNTNAAKGWLEIGPGIVKPGVTYDLTTVFSGTGSDWTDFADFFVKGMAGYESVAIDSAKQSVTFTGISSDRRFLSWDLANYAGSTFSLNSIVTDASAYTYNLDPVSEGKTGLGTAENRQNLWGYCANLSPGDEINIVSGVNYFNELVVKTMFTGVTENTRLTINFTGGTSYLNNFNTSIPFWNTPYTDITVSGENTEVIADKTHGINQGNSITVKDGGTLRLTTLNSNSQSFAHGQSITVDGGSLIITGDVIPFSNSQVAKYNNSNELTFAHGSTVSVSGKFQLTRYSTSELNIIGNNDITLGSLTLDSGSEMNLMADHSGFSTIQVNGDVNTLSGIITASLESGVSILNSSKWTVVQGKGAFSAGPNSTDGLFLISSDAAKKQINVSLNPNFKRGTASQSGAQSIETSSEIGYLDFVNVSDPYDLQFAFGGDAALWGSFVDYFEDDLATSGLFLTNDPAAQTIEIAGRISGNVLAWDLQKFNEQYGLVGDDRFLLTGATSQSVPEPAGIALMVLGLILALPMFRRQKRS